jgi:uncharacterized membrane protein
MLTSLSTRATAVYGVLLTISLVWLGSIFAAPWLMAGRHDTASIILYQSFSVVCHQIADRSFDFFGFPLGVCSRCTAIYTGFVIGLILYPFIRNLRNQTFPERKWIILSTIPMVIDHLGGYVGLVANTFLSRTVTGLLFGIVVAFYILPGFISTFGFWRDQGSMKLNARAQR